MNQAARRKRRFFSGINCCRLTLVEAAPRATLLAERFPALTPADFQELKESIKIHGQLSPIVLNHLGEILDGKNRLRACRELGLEPRTVCCEAVTNASPDQSITEAQFVFAQNVLRRHLTATQRATLCLEFLQFTRKEAEVRRRKAQARGRQTQRANRQNGNGSTNGEKPKWSRGPTVAAILAGRASVGIPTMQAVIAVHDSDAPELLDAMAHGKLSASAAASKIAATKRNGAKPINPATLEKTAILGRWKKAWKAFLKPYPVKQHGFVREVVSEYFCQEKA